MSTTYSVWTAPSSVKRTPGILDDTIALIRSKSERSRCDSTRLVLCAIRRLATATCLDLLKGHEGTLKSKTSSPKIPHVVSFRPQSLSPSPWLVPWCWQVARTLFGFWQASSTQASKEPVEVSRSHCEKSVCLKMGLESSYVRCNHHINIYTH